MNNKCEHNWVEIYGRELKCTKCSAKIKNTVSSRDNEKIEKAA